MLSKSLYEYNESLDLHALSQEGMSFQDGVISLLTTIFKEKLSQHYPLNELTNVTTEAVHLIASTLYVSRAINLQMLMEHVPEGPVN